MIRGTLFAIGSTDTELRVAVVSVKSFLLTALRLLRIVEFLFVVLETGIVGRQLTISQLVSEHAGFGSNVGLL